MTLNPADHVATTTDDPKDTRVARQRGLTSLWANTRTGIFALLFAVLVANFLTQDGESNWFEGAQLITLYLVLGLVFFFA